MTNMYILEFKKKWRMGLSTRCDHFDVSQNNKTNGFFVLFANAACEIRDSSTQKRESVLFCRYRRS